MPGRETIIGVEDGKPVPIGEVVALLDSLIEAFGQLRTTTQQLAEEGVRAIRFQERRLLPQNRWIGGGCLVVPEPGEAGLAIGGFVEDLLIAQGGETEA
jgi:hypothetical protein